MAPTARGLNEFDQLLRGPGLRTLFQPIVEVATGATVGYEALTRGPVGSRFETAEALLTEAYRTGRVVEFDWAARASACRAALAADVGRGPLLFLNVEPLALGSSGPAALMPDIEEAFRSCRIIFEVTERSLARDPASLLDGIDRQRPNAAGIALDDVGSRPATLSMLPVLNPDVIKLDRTVTGGGTDLAALKVLDIAHEEAERTGALLLAEGVQDEAGAVSARTIGATLAQGWHYGHPGPLPTERAPQAWSVPPIATVPVPDIQLPSDALGGRWIGRAGPEFLTALARQIVLGLDLAEPAVVVLTTPRAGLVEPVDHERLARFARRGVVVTTHGPDLPPEAPDGGPAPDSSTVDGRWPGASPVAGEWAAVALGAGFAAAMLARPVPGDPDQFDFGVTHDRQRVIAAVRCLLRRIRPRPA